MKPNVVVDIGNSRIKWGYCAQDRVGDVVSLDPDNEDSWEEQIKPKALKEPIKWAVAGVHPERVDRFMDWVRKRGDKAALIHDRTLLPIKIEVGEPGRVGIDRLLNAVAARSRVLPGDSIAIIDAGSAVTVDWVDREGAFRGGAIFPGLQLMAKALHEHTAALPLIDVNRSTPRHILPGNSTELAIRGGVFWAVAGGITSIIRLFGSRTEPYFNFVIYLTGGDAKILQPILHSETKLWPEMTLEGVRLAAEALP
jgi:type III pantothenate kinase